MRLLAALGYALSVAAHPAEPVPPTVEWLSGGSIVRTPSVHAGVRPQADITNDGPAWGLGFTAQVTFRRGWW